MVHAYLNWQKCATLVALFCLFSITAFAQRSVGGKVVDVAGNPLVGASVIVKGTTNGTYTDDKGTFSLSVDGNSAGLIVSYLGYRTKEVALSAAETTISVTLEEGDLALNEVVVTGYSQQNRRNITGAVAVVDTKDMTKFAASNFADQLQGKVAGVQMSTSGDPGSSAFVRIRGIGTINQNEPLYVIDGIPVQNESNLNFLNPNDIESMQVLKDAASASIYGSRAANGVIVITTKKGKRGTSKLSLDVFTGFQTPSKVPETLNPEEFLQVQQGLATGQGQTFTSNIYINEGGKWVFPDFAVRGLGGFKAGDPAVDPAKYFLNTDPTSRGVPADYLILKTNKEGTNWFNELFSTAPMSNYQLSASGGSDKGQYYFSANYYDHQGILLGNEYKRFQTRVNTVFNVKKGVRVGESFNIAYQTTRGGFGNPNEGSALINTYGMPQLVPVYDIQGNFASPANFNSNVGNPVGQQTRSKNYPGHGMRIVGSVFGEVDLTSFLTFKSSFGIDYGSGPSQSYNERIYEATEGNVNPNSLRNSYYLNRNWVFFNTLTFKKTFGNHDITALAGYESKEYYYEGFNTGGSELAFDDPNFRLLQNIKPSTITSSSYRGENRVVSQFAQFNYGLSDKYLLSATIRRDGSSRFIDNKWGFFPSASVGWRLSKEAFMSSVSAINDLKLRASYGVLGNNEVGGDYPGFSNFGSSAATTNYPINGSNNSTTPGFDQTSTGSPGLKWESTAIANIGIDATIFNNLDVMVEWFTRTTSDMIYNVELPLEGGAVGRQAQNIGEMRNTGIDLALTYRGRGTGGFNYSIGVTGSTYKNEVVALEANSNTFIRSAGSRIGDITYTQAGLPISQFYGYVVDGLWKSQAEINEALREPGDAKVGRFRYRDLNADGKIDNNDETFLGSPLPNFILGLNLTANYKNFDATIYLNGVYGNKIFNFVKYFTHFNAFQRNRSKEFLYEAGKTLPVLDGGDNYSSQRNSYYVEDGSYTRLRNLQIGYSLPAAIASKAGMSKCRIYVQGQNLFTLTKYSGLDPDVTITNITEGFNSQRDLSLGVDNGRYPLARTVIFGVNIEF